MTSGDITLPWMAILGFLDVLGVMAAVLWIVHKRERKALTAAADASNPPLVSPS